MSFYSCCPHLIKIYSYETIGLDKAYCFKFTWPGSETTSIDCANYTNIPCFQPIHSM